MGFSARSRFALSLTAGVVVLGTLPFLARAQDEGAEEPGGEAVEEVGAELPSEVPPELLEPGEAEAAPDAEVTAGAVVTAGAEATTVAPPPAGSEAAKVEAALGSIGSSWLFTRADSGLQVVDVATGQRVYAKNDDKLLLPASTMKVLTSAAALRQLGPAYRFTTDLFHDGEISPEGVLQGNLYVKGHGDPTFGTEKLWKMVDDLALAGIESIDGGVVFDDSFHEKGTALVGWDKADDVEKGTSYFPTLSALSLNANTAVIVIRPGVEVGSIARATLETPVRDYIQIDNQLKTGGAHTRKRIDVKREVLPGATKFTLTGSVPIDDRDRTTLRRTVADPTAHFMAAFREKMNERDIEVDGRYTVGVTPPDAKMLLSVDSHPLSHIAADMNKASLNFAAEQVLRTVGAEIMGEGSTRAGLAVVADYLSSLGVPPSDAVLVNGSGLSRDIKIKPSVLTAVLVDMARDPQVGSEFASSLAISGTDGTLWSRLREDPGRLRGKTGTIDGVHCLAGYIDSQAGRRYAFAFLVNNYGTRLQAVREMHDTFARRLFSIGGPGSE